MTRLFVALMCLPLPPPVFFADNQTKRFYVRVQNQTNEYSGNDLLNYRKERWPEIELSQPRISPRGCDNGSKQLAEDDA